MTVLITRKDVRTKPETVALCTYYLKSDMLELLKALTLNFTNPVSVLASNHVLGIFSALCYNSIPR